MAKVVVTKATNDQQPIFANLIQLYLYDMTEELPFAIGADGLFQYDYLQRFWQHPYLIYADGELAGFALVINECPVSGKSPCFFMAEFFVLKAYRQCGVGTKAMADILANHRGPWHIGVIDKNIIANVFLASMSGKTARPHQYQTTIRWRELVGLRISFIKKGPHRSGPFYQ